MCLIHVFKKGEEMLTHHQSCASLLFSDVPKMATRPDGITSPVGSISVTNALTITTEGLFTNCWRFPWWRARWWEWWGEAEGVRQLRRSPQAYWVTPPFQPCQLQPCQNFDAVVCCVRAYVRAHSGLRKYLLWDSHCFYSASCEKCGHCFAILWPAWVQRFWGGCWRLQGAGQSSLLNSFRY